MSINNKNSDKSKNNYKTKEQNKKMNMEAGEDSTKYVEWMPSFFEWVTPEKQKNRAEELNNMTKNKDI